MITIDLRQEPLTLPELLQRAEMNVIRIVSASGQVFILEESEESFEQEVERLGKSDKFLAFLAERAKEPAVMSLDEYEQFLSKHQ
jgi:hypothetical protein